jgi:acyl-CoA thioester hydrolase
MPPFVHRLRVRYHECDPQGIVFNATDFACFDIVLTELWRAALGSYGAMVASGVDVQVVDASASFHAPARFDDELALEMTVVRLGTTSITSDFEERRAGELLVSGRLVHGCVETQDSYGQRYVPRGYARAVADVIGTRNSSGCWDYGGAAERQSGVDLVELPGRAGVVQREGRDDRQLRRVRPGGDRADRGDLALVRLRLLARRALLRQLGAADRRGARHAARVRLRVRPHAADRPVGDRRRAGPDPALRRGATHARGYDRSPDYDAFWLERDYRKDARRFRVPALIAHGWQDYNVKQEEGVELFKRLDGSPPPPRPCSSSRSRARCGARARPSSGGARHPRAERRGRVAQLPAGAARRTVGGFATPRQGPGRQRVRGLARCRGGRSDGTFTP